MYKNGTLVMGVGGNPRLRLFYELIRRTLNFTLGYIIPEFILC
jgi:hypothetical protein